MPESSSPGREASQPTPDPLPPASISSQHIRQVRLVVPSVIEAVGELADRHPSLAADIVADISSRSQRADEIWKIVVQGADARSRRGQIAGWVVAAAFIVFGMTLIWNERQVEGLVALATVIGPYLGVSVWRGRSASRERVRKAAQILAPPDNENR